MQFIKQQHSIGALLVASIGLLCCTSAETILTNSKWRNHRTAPQAGQHSTSTVCYRELEHANRTMSQWASTMEEMVNESKLSTSIRDTIHSEANRILDMIEDFGNNVGKKQVSANQLARDLVNIRRRSNKMALDIYLNTFDMRWPQNSLQLGIIVERVQQACLDRATIVVLESEPNPLNTNETPKE